MRSKTPKGTKPHLKRTRRARTLITRPPGTPWKEMGLAPPKITKRSRAIDAVQRILASWEAYARSGQADNPDEAIRGFVGNLLDSVDFARMKPNMRRLALLGVCCCLPMSQLIRVRARAESEFTLLAQCLAATEKR